MSSSTVNQSFPPASVLKTMRSFQVRVKLDDLGQKHILEEPVCTAISGALTAAGFEVVPQGQPCQSMLVCDLQVIPTLSYSGGSPIAFAFTADMAVLTTLAFQPTSDLFVIWRNLALVSTDAAGLFKSAIATAGRLAETLVSRIKEVQQP
jgi:hypothetical protein